MKFNIDFYKYRNVAYIFSTLLLISSISLFLFKNLNLGIDFKGGIMIEAKFNNPPNLTDLRNKITMNKINTIKFIKASSIFLNPKKTILQVVLNIRWIKYK